MNFSYAKNLGGFIIYSDINGGSIVATFGNDLGGLTAFAAFCRGVSTDRTCTLYDRDKGEYVIGTLDQMVA